MGLEFRLLGPLEVVRDGVPVPVGPRRQRAVLARLLLEQGRPVSTDRLVEDVWGGVPPDGAVRTLRSYLSRLRSALGEEVIATRSPGYAFGLDVDLVDVVGFERLAAEGRELLQRRNARAARERLGRALSRWRGTPLEDLPPEPFVLAEARRLEELHLLAVEDRVAADLALGSPAALVAELEALVRDHPLRERLWASLMTALYRAGRQADALAAYQQARAVLDEELGLEPGEELQRLEVAVLRQDLAKPERVPPTNLPTPLTAFIGREREVAAVLAAVADRRLVTVTGAGGAGKTRVALETARRALPGFGDGVWWVDLAPLADPALVAHTVAGAAGVDDSSSRGRQDVLAEHLAEARALLVLDNCEHLTDACATLVERLLSGCPRVHVLATSREPLGVPGEAVYDLPPLASPPADADEDPTAYDAVRLFLDRSAVPVPAAALPAVARTCRDLDGLPLAIEIAAAQTRLLSPEEIADRLGDRFRLLTYWSRTALPRHRTLRASLDWSHALLRPDEQETLARLSVLVGSFSLAAVEAVAGSGDRTLEVLRRLVDASLVVRTGDQGPPRFRLLETVRQYAAEQAGRAGSADEAAARAAAFFAGLADAAAAAADGTDEPARYADVDADLGNVRAALAWADRAGDTALLSRLARGLGTYWRLRGHLDEGELWLSRALAAGDALPATERADLLGLLGHIAVRRGDFRAARQHLERAVALARVAGSRARLARLLHRLAFCRRAQGEFPAACALLEEGLALATAEGDRRTASHQTGSLADIAVLQGRYDDAERLYAQAWALAQPATPALEVAYLDSTARLALVRGDLDEGARRSTEGLDRARRLGDSWHVGLTLVDLGYVARRRGDVGTAVALLTEALDVLEALHEVPALADAVDAVAGLLVDAQEAAPAARLLAAAAALRAGVGGHAGDLSRPWVVEDTATARRHLGEAEHDAERAQGSRLSLEDTVALARAALTRLADRAGRAPLPGPRARAGAEPRTQQRAPH